MEGNTGHKVFDTQFGKFQKNDGVFINKKGNHLKNVEENYFSLFLVRYVIMINLYQSTPPICIQQMSEHIIHLYGVFNNTINEIPARGDNAG